MTSVSQDSGFIKQLLEYLDQTTDPGAFSPNSPPDVPVLGEPANLREPLAPARVSVENVQSKTTQTQLKVPQKKEKEVGEPADDPLGSLDPLGEAEVEQWIQGASGPGPGLLSEPQKKDMGSLRAGQTEEQRKRLRVEEELTVGVATYTNPGKDADFGYIITEE